MKLEVTTLHQFGVRNRKYRQARECVEPLCLLTSLSRL